MGGIKAKFRCSHYVFFLPTPKPVSQSTTTITNEQPITTDLRQGFLAVLASSDVSSIPAAQLIGSFLAVNKDYYYSHSKSDRQCTGKFYDLRLPSSKARYFLPERG